MGEHVVERVVRLMTQQKIHVVDSNVLILGLAFKENCPDIRNTRVVDLVQELKRYRRQCRRARPLGVRGRGAS